MIAAQGELRACVRWPDRAIRRRDAERRRERRDIGAGDLERAEKSRRVTLSLRREAPLAHDVHARQDRRDIHIIAIRRIAGGVDCRVSASSAGRFRRRKSKLAEQAADIRRIESKGDGLPGIARAGLDIERDFRPPERAFGCKGGDPFAGRAMRLEGERRGREQVGALSRDPRPGIRRKPRDQRGEVADPVRPNMARERNAIPARSTLGVDRGAAEIGDVQALDPDFRPGLRQLEVQRAAVDRG